MNSNNNNISNNSNNNSNSNEFISPIFWEQGLFLQPQHFQLLQRFLQHINTKNVQLLQPYFYGFNNYTINEMQLNNGIFEMSNFEALFPDGTWINFPENAVLASRRFDEVWNNPEDDLPIYIGISLEKTISSNNNDNNVYQTDLTDANNLQQTLPKNFRYVTDFNPQKFADLLTDETPADVRTLKYNIHLYFGKEVDSLNTQIQSIMILPIAILKRDGERIILSKHFVPPILSLQNSDILRMLVATIRDTLLSRAKQLEEYKIVGNDITQNANISGGSSGIALYITLFSVLGAISRHLPILNAFLHSKDIHPWNVFLELCSIVGELSIFSADLSPIGETDNGENVLPKYNHNNLYDCFNAATQIITRLVDSLVIGPEYSFVLSLQNDGDYQGLRIAYLSHEALSKRYCYWLLVRSQLVKNNNNNENNLEENNNISSSNLNLANHIKRGGKLAPLKSLNGILTRALPGIRLVHSEIPPAGVPRRKNTLYFQIDDNDSLWQEVLKDGEVAFSLPGQIDDLFVQIMVIEK